VGQALTLPYGASSGETAAAGARSAARDLFMQRRMQATQKATIMSAQGRKSVLRPGSRKPAYALDKPTVSCCRLRAEGARLHNGPKERSAARMLAMKQKRLTAGWCSTSHLPMLMLLLVFVVQAAAGRSTGSPGGCWPWRLPASCYIDHLAPGCQGSIYYSRLLVVPPLQLARRAHTAAARALRTQARRLRQRPPPRSQRATAR